MRRILLLAAGIGLAAAAAGADIEAGKAKAAQVCAACHGANGISVADSIPNLAGQRAAYVETQLKALKDGTRKHQVMGAIAAQLNADDIGNLAAYFATQAGAVSSAKSEFLPHLVKTGVRFPDAYKTQFTKYHTINFPATRQVRVYYANDAAIQAAREGKALPDGSVLFTEVYAAQLDADKKPVTGADGFYVADKLLFYSAMARDTGWGEAIPEMLRNENWNYAVFTLDKQLRPGVNQAECLACHKPLDKQSFTFTLDQITAVARKR